MGDCFQDDQMPQALKQRAGNPCGFVSLGLQQGNDVQGRGGLLLEQGT